ncbi:MAG: tRNA 2-thiouridine(34) synthase MnmA [Planctomycetes bacterium]|nr:tRNA 2-thiouridine(34) synthase MnmA [Planctomycetota bacterium]
MSGGVDSSVAAALLLEAGHEVIGCFMRLGSPGDELDELTTDCDTDKIKIGHQGCCSINDAADARLVAAKLGIPFYVCNFKRDFGRIIDYFVAEYNAGRTPNPCIRCNDWLKFGKLHEYAQQMGADAVASGHYARTGSIENRSVLLRGVDVDKDQSYVLFGIPQVQLRHMLFPIGAYNKSEIRQLASDLDLPVSNKPDSQEICFVPDNDYAGLVKRRTPDEVAEGDVLDADGNVIGKHPGHQHFTIGQRRKIGVALGYPIYVTERHPDANTIRVGSKEDLLASGCIARDCNWFDQTLALQGTWIRCRAQIRYNAKAVPARVRAIESRRAIKVQFDEPQPAVAPGQAVVCYVSPDDDEHHTENEFIMCGGWIDQAMTS